MERAKIQLSPDELLIVQDAELLLTKNRIIQKIYNMFGLLIPEVQMVFKTSSFFFPQEIFAAPPKISKGENYKGLPYVMLDYPRCFGREDTFAIRTMFWWGSFFSTTLHLKGKYKNAFATGLTQELPVFIARNFYMSTHSDEWRHDFEIDNYTPLEGMSLATWEKNLKKEFFKIAAKISLEEWDEVPANLLLFYTTIIQATSASFQGDEKGL